MGDDRRAIRGNFSPAEGQPPDVNGSGTSRPRARDGAALVCAQKFDLSAASHRFSRVVARHRPPLRSRTQHVATRTAD